MNEQDRIERAYRLAWPDDPGVLDVSAPEDAWDEAIGRIADTDSALSWAILALALLDEGGGTLGRWEIFTVDGDVDRILLDSDTYANRNDQYQWVTGAWPASAYTDGTAQELLLLMAAADELARRGAQP